MTSARVLTPGGRGAIAVVEVVGPAASRLIDACFRGATRRNAAEQPIDGIRFGVWRHDDSGSGEELLVVRTSEQRFEVHCHGGVAAPAAIVRSLMEREASGTSNDYPSSPSADALRMLQRASTETAAAVLLDQAGGALERAIEGIISAIRSTDVDTALQRIKALLRYRRLADRIVDPWRVVVAGPPNVGKSSLVNALVGYPRAIVFDQPGTTRDAVNATTAIGGWPVRLTDTAGLRATDDAIEAAGVDLARRALQKADVAIYVSEATDTGSKRSVSFASDTFAIAVASKVDLAQTPLDLPTDVIPTSVVDRCGIDRLLDAIERKIDAPTPPAGSAVPFRARHVEGLVVAREALAAGRSEAALRAMEGMLAPAGLC